MKRITCSLFAAASLWSQLTLINKTFQLRFSWSHLELKEPFFFPITDSSAAVNLRQLMHILFFSFKLLLYNKWLSSCHLPYQLNLQVHFLNNMLNKYVHLHSCHVLWFTCRNKLSYITRHYFLNTFPNRTYITPSHSNITLVDCRTNYIQGHELM